MQALLLADRFPDDEIALTCYFGSGRVGSGRPVERALAVGQNSAGLAFHEQGHKLADLRAFVPGMEVSGNFTATRVITSAICVDSSFCAMSSVSGLISP